MRWSRNFRNVVMYSALFPLIMFVGLFIHELGHAVVALILGGNVLEIGFRASGGFVRFSGVASGLLCVVGLAGGVAWAVYYCFLASKITKMLYITALFSLIYSIFEAFYIVDNAPVLYANMTTAGIYVSYSTFIILLLNVCANFVKMRWEW